MRQPHATGEIIEIDVIDADPDAFGGEGSATTHHERTPLPRWAIPVAAGLVVALWVTAAIWHPWVPEPKWRTFAPPAAPAAVLTDQLVLGLSPDTVIGLDLGQELAPREPTPIGYVFAEPDGTYETNAWALFHSRASAGGSAVEPSDSTDLVRGLQAEVHKVRVRTTIRWGPIDGEYWDAETNRFDKAAALAFANAVGVVDGVPAIERSYRLGALQPLGDVKTLTRVQVLASYLGGEPVLSAFTPTVVTYETSSGPVRAASIGVETPDALAMAEFYFGHSSDITVHGVPALSIASRSLGSVIVWQEGDRLMAVAGSESDAAMRILAESLHAATPDEWAAVVDASQPEVTFSSSPDQVTIGVGTAADGTAWRASVTLGNPTVICVHLGAAEETSSSCTFTTPLSPATHLIEAPTIPASFVVAVVPMTSVDVLRITTADGAVETFHPVPVDDVTSAVVAELPTGSKYTVVDPSG
ncbi:MAG: hypothetical protein WCC60_07825 [Ilumatobacteraceae bacterium]